MFTLFNDAISATYVQMCSMNYEDDCEWWIGNGVKESGRGFFFRPVGWLVLQLFNDDVSYF
jgi:hypothetical protein